VRNGYYSRTALCPFYNSIIQTKGGQVIGVGCESMSDNLGFTATNFVRLQSKQDLRDFFDIFCGDMYLTCPWYQAISKKYEK